jgi:cell division ATPase FtsA
LVIAAAARREVVRDHLNLMARTGLDPKIVTLSTLALAEMLTRVRNGSGGAHLVVDIESGCTSMVLVDAAGTPRAMRTITYGAEFQSGVIPVSATHAIFAAARQTMLAHGGEPRPELVLAGSAAEVPGACELVARALQTPVRDVGDFDYSAMIRSHRTIPKRFTGCIAMLLAEAPSNPAELINFRQGGLAFHGRSGAPAPLRVPMMLAAAAAGAAVVQFALGIGVGVRQLHLLDRQITMITAPALGNPDPATAATALQAKITEMTKRLHLMGGSLGHGSPLEVLSVLSRALPPGLAAEVTTLQIDDSGLKLEGEADSFTAVDQVKRSLERNGEFGQVQLDHAAAASDSGKVEFHLSAAAAD